MRREIGLIFIVVCSFGKANTPFDMGLRLSPEAVLRRLAAQILPPIVVPAEAFLAAHAPLADLPHVLASLADGSSSAIKTCVDVRR